MKPLADYNPDYSWAPPDNRRWIDRQTDVTPTERIAYDLLDNERGVYEHCSPPYILEMARKLVVVLEGKLSDQSAG